MYKSVKIRISTQFVLLGLVFLFSCDGKGLKHNSMFFPENTTSFSMGNETFKVLNFNNFYLLNDTDIEEWEENGS